jgi:FtsH-binding integral membrane protein
VCFSNTLKIKEPVVSYNYQPEIAARALPNERVAFLRRTYGHLAGAILVFTILEILAFAFVIPTKEASDALVGQMFGSPISMLILIGAFIGFGWMAQIWAQSSASRALQYVGLGIYIVLQALIFLPLLSYAVYYTGDYTLLPQAAILTLVVFGGLTAGVFITKKDFSFLGGILWLGSFLALGLVLVAAFFGGFSLGLWFSFAMVALACGFILYDTSNVLHHYRTDQHVAAALQLFASVALLFFYILRILIASRR